MKDPNEFPAGTYVVLLSTCSGNNTRWASLPINHIYRLKHGSNTYCFSVDKSVYGTSDRWQAMRNHNPHLLGQLKLRSANSREIVAYELNEGPLNIRRANLKITPDHRLEVKVKIKQQYINEGSSKKTIRGLQEV